MTPDTILRWYRELITNKYDGTARRRSARSGTAASLHGLVVQFATENPTWEYTRLRGALGNLGHELGRNTIKRILADHGLTPAPKPGKTMPWKTFLKAHFGVIAATDFFTVEVLTFTGLVRYVVLFVIDLESRRVHIAGVVPPTAWRMDPAGRAQSRRPRRRLSQGQALPGSRPRPVVHRRVPRGSARRRLHLPQAPCPEPKSEFICRALRTPD